MTHALPLMAELARALGSQRIRLPDLAAYLWLNTKPQGLGVTLGPFATLGRPGLLEEALETYDAYQGGALDPEALAAFLADLTRALGNGGSDGRLVLNPLPDHNLAEKPFTVADSLADLIDKAREQVLLVAPFADAQGLGSIEASILGALARGVTVRLVATGLADVGSVASQGLETLRREARGLPGILIAMCPHVDGTKASFRLHAKLYVADQRAGFVGSSNLTLGGLATNFEVNLRLGVVEAELLSSLVDALVARGLIDVVFSTMLPASGSIA